MSSKKGKSQVSQAAAVLGRMAQAKIALDPKKQAEIKLLAAAGRRRIPAKKRSEIAGKAGSSISPEMAHERALKAWATKRARASKY